MASESAGVRTSAAERVHSRLTAFVSRLPFGLNEVLAPTLVGFAVINSLTFTLDVAILVTARSGLDWPLWIAVSAGYTTAFALSFTLNRWLNFRSHAPVGRQLVIYLAVVCMNYLALVLGLVTVLTHLGLDYRLARLAAAGAEAGFMYCAMRWLVFRDTLPSHPDSSR